MSIDDNHQNLSLIQQALADQFDVISSTGEESITDLVIDCEPDIILLDIMLGHVSGYDICREIRQLPQAANCFIFFISSLNSPQDKIKAYTAGGDDYICKPVDLTELEYKLEAVDKRIEEQKQLADKMEEASLAAMASMRQSSDLAVLLEFFTLSLQTHDFDSLFDVMQRAMGAFKLNCAVEFRTDRMLEQYPKDQVTQLESEILDLGKRAQRIVPFGKNVLFNAKQCSLLIKKLPLEAEGSARLKDHMVIFLDIVNSRVEYIQAEQNRRQRRKRAVDALEKELNSALAQVKGHKAQLENQIEQIFVQLNQTAQNHTKDQFSETLQQSRQVLDNLVESTLGTEFKSDSLDELLQAIRQD